MLYRSDAPRPGDTPPPAAVWPPALVVDLRSAEERRSTHALTAPGTEVLEVSLSPDANPTRFAQSGGDVVTLLGIYHATVVHQRQTFGQVVAAVAEADGPVLVHCAAGKDRTGMVIALVLAAIGVGVPEILADYERTAANMAAVIARMGDALDDVQELEMLRQVVAQHPDLVRTSAAAMQTLLATVNAADGGAVGWLREAGVTDTQLDRLRARLLAA